MGGFRDLLMIWHHLPAALLCFWSVKGTKHLLDLFFFLNCKHLPVLRAAVWTCATAGPACAAAARCQQASFTNQSSSAWASCKLEGCCLVQSLRRGLTRYQPNWSIRLTGRPVGAGCLWPGRPGITARCWTLTSCPSVCFTTASPHMVTHGFGWNTEILRVGRCSRRGLLVPDQPTDCSLGNCYPPFLPPAPSAAADVWTAEGVCVFAEC